MDEFNSSNEHDEKGTGGVTPISSVNGSGNGVPKIEVGSDGFIGRDLAIKATKKPARQKVLVFPEYTEWAGAKYLIKEIRGGEYSRVNSALVKGKGADQRVDTTEQDARLIIAASINKDGSQMWHPKNDLQTVMDFPASVTEFLVEEIRNLFQKPKDAEEQSVGNSTSTASNG